MLTEKQIKLMLKNGQQELKKMGKPAKVHANAPLALMQMGMESQIRVLKQVLEIDK